MELKLLPYQLPDKLGFNYEELKAELVAKTQHYETMVYTDDQIKDAKTDRANLNKLKKALNDERIRMEKEYMIPFNDFKAKINDLIKTIDSPVAVIDKQIKEFEEQKKSEKLEQIQEYWNRVVSPKHPLTLERVMDTRWLNSSVSIGSIQEDINGILAKYAEDIETLSNLPEIGFEAAEVYKTTLDLNKAISEGRRLFQIQKDKEEQERLKAEAEAKKKEEVTPDPFPADAMNPPVAEASEQPEEVADWVKFRAYLTKTDALALRDFFVSRGITFEAL